MAFNNLSSECVCVCGEESWGWGFTVPMPPFRNPELFISNQIEESELRVNEREAQTK